ncbi:hypothetical protein LEN26_003558 [Aphanomyces euteiches]|nr:hypothetical protein LEN26_003558 [Aphanomyces euteiches]
MWHYGAIVEQIAALHRDCTFPEMDQSEYTSEAKPLQVFTSVHVHLQALAPKTNNPIVWLSYVLLDVQTQRKHKFKLKRRYLEIRGKVLWVGKHPMMMQMWIHIDNLTAVEPSCLEPNSLLLVTPNMYILIALEDEVECARWRGLLRHGRPLGYNTKLLLKTHDHDIAPCIESMLQLDWSIAKCMNHLGLDPDEYAIHVNGTNLFWSNPSATLDEYAIPGNELQLTAIPRISPQSTASITESTNSLNVRLNQVCHIFEEILELRDGQRIVADRVQTSCLVRMELAEGSRVHCSVDSDPFLLRPSSSQQLEDVWYTLWNIPDVLTDSWRLVCTIFALDGQQPQDDDPVDESQWIKLGTTGTTLLTVNGNLLPGSLYLEILDSTADPYRGPLPLGVTHGSPYIHLECLWKDLYSSRRTSQLLHNSPTILKQGTLYEWTSIGLWSKWTARWCAVTSQGQLIMDKSHPISLENARLAIADKYTSTSRRASASGSKSTQKEYTTYAFTIEVDKQTSLILGSLTRHAREDWLHTLRMAIPTTSARMSTRKSVEMTWSFRGTTLSDDVELMEDPSVTLQWLLTRMEVDPLFSLSSFQRTILWQYRHTLPKHFSILPRLLTCREWTNSTHADELKVILAGWQRPKHATEYLILLGSSLSHLSTVRSFAIDRLESLDDTTLAKVLPQLVQCIKWEPFATSRLLTWLIQRAVENPRDLGVPLFWALHVETFVPHCTQRFEIAKQAYLAASGRPMRRMLRSQLELCQELNRLTRDMQSIASSSSLDVLLRQRIAALNVQFAGRMSLPVHGRCKMVQFVSGECRVLKSPKRPIWLTIETTSHKKVSVIFKAGDDVRQDMLSLQLFGLMEQLWTSAKLPIQMQTYGCVATSPTSGVVEVVADAVTTAAIHKEGGVLGPLQEERFTRWLRTQNPAADDFSRALETFRQSCAGACVATHVLGIGDRHNDNIMMTQRGLYFHIDFGHFLGHCKYHMNFKRDKTPFVFTKEMAFTLGGVGSVVYTSFVELCGQAYNELRQHLHLLTTLLVLMLPANMAELRDMHDIYHVVDALALDLTPTQASQDFAAKIEACLGHPYKRIDNTIHNLVHLLRT